MKFESKYVRCIWSDDLPDSFVGVVADSGSALKAKVEANKQTTVSRRVNEQWPFAADDNCWHLAYYDPNYENKLAYEKGEKIQVWSDEEDEWLDDETPDWTKQKHRIKPKGARMTYRQLSEWLAKGNGQVASDSLIYVSGTYCYNTEYDDKEVLENYRIRRWGSGIWLEPTVSVYQEDCND